MNKLVNILMQLVKQFQAAQKEREKGTGKPTRREAPRTRRVEQGTTVEYTPELDGDPDPGEVRREGAILDEDRFNDVVGNLARYHDIIRR